MKRKRSVSKTVLSFCLAILLALQAVTLPASAYAGSAQDGFGTAAGPYSVTEAVYDDPSSVTEAVYEMPPDFLMMAVDPADKTSVIEAANSPFPLEVIQDEKTVPDDGTGIINGRQPFTLSLTNLKVPVYGDDQSADPESIIQKGDKVIFDKATYFPRVNLTATGSKAIMVGSQKIATATFSEAAVTITFDGDDVFFNGIKFGVLINLTLAAKGDLSEIDYGEDGTADIFGKQYTMNNPPLTPKYSIAINALDSVKPSQYGYVNLGKNSFADGTITWKVDIAATDLNDNTIPLSLEGTTFYDDLSKDVSYNAAGVYVEDSFTVNEQKVTPVYADGALSYTFPPGSDDKATITFKTWIPKGLYYYEYQPVPGNDGGQKIATTAQLKDENGNELIKASSYRVNIYPDWIQQTGVVSKQGEDTFVTWTIDVNRNYNKQGLKNFTITDALPNGLIFESAAYQLWDTNTNNWSASTTITPTGENNDTYSIPGGENNAVRLVILSKVDSGSNFKNWARANWKLENPPGGLQDNDATVGDNPQTVSAFAEITVGAHGLTKSGTLTADDLKIGAATWTVTLTPQYDDPGTVVYDLLVHSRTPNFIDPSKLDSKGKVDSTVLTTLANGVKGNTDLIGLQFLEDSFTTASDDLEWEVIPLYQDDVQVADLLKVSGYTDKQASFTFRTLMTDPKQFAGQYSTSGYAAPRYNRAYLFDGVKYSNIYAQNYVNRHGNMLDKGMLFASIPLKADGTPEKNVTSNDINSYITNDSNEAWTIAGYDRVTKTATFRLAVNHKGLDTEEMAKYGANRVASDIQLVDTLPEGWEFVPYDASGKFYELYRGYSSNNSDTGYGTQVKAESPIPPDSDAHVVSFSRNQSGNVGTFTFSKLESPYVIFVKASPTAEKLNAEIAAGKTKYEGVNEAELTIKWGDVEIKYTDSRKVIVPLSSLTKTVTKPAPGIQEWTVNYAPSFAMTDEVYLQDTLGAGLKLREDENGKLSLTSPDIAVYRATMTPSGALARDGAALDLTGPDPEVRVEMQKSDGNPTKLIFKMKDPNQFYQFVYQTESSGMSPGIVGNKIELLGDDSLPPVEASEQTTLDANDVSGAAGSNGVLYIQKVDPANKSLPGVEFTLYEADGVTEAKNQQGNTIKGTTDANGKLMLLIPTPGLYQLKQTYIDENTYLPTTTVYTVRVADVKDSPTFVDGELVTLSDPVVVPTPVWVPGDLQLNTAIEGQGADPDKEFEYTITFSNHKSYSYTGSITGTVADGGTVKLKGGQSITIEDIPDGITYTIVQENYAVEGYTTDPENRTRTGSIVAEQTVEANFVNAKYLLGQLTIGKTVEGNGGDKNKAFDFTVTFGGPGADGTYTYTTSDGMTGTIQSGGQISLKHGETAVIDGIPRDTTYTVTEADYTSEGYTTTWPDRKTTGTITEGGDHEERIVNTRMVYGGLLIGETVEGTGADKSKGFVFTVEFPDAAAGDAYAYTKSDGTTGTVKTGGTITLKHGETVGIEGIPSGDRYKVTQTDYSDEDYTANPENREYSGTIVEKKIEEARFVNAKYLPGNLTLTANPDTVPGDGETPSELTAILTDYAGKPVADTEIVFTLPDNTERRVTTDAEGKAVILYIPPKLETAITEKHTIIAKVDSLTEGKLSADTEVTAVPAAIIGVLRDNETGEVIPNATIVITDKTNGNEQVITTDAYGAYFHPVTYGGDYTISYTKMINVNGVEKPFIFTQKAYVDGDVKGGKLIPADITAVGVVLLKQSGGQDSLLSSELADKMRIYLKDADDNYIEENGHPKAFPVASNGSFSVDGLSAGNYKMEVRYEFAPGMELTVIRDANLDVKATGELNISQELVDPYGIITDEKTGMVIEGAEVTLYYADTERNRKKNIVPGTKVTLSEIPGFEPNNNASPSQNSDENGAYAYMVFPDTDYYLVVTKAGYKTYTSPIISVGTDIVRHDIELNAVSSGGGNGGGNNGSSGGNNGSGNSNNGSGNVDNGTDTSNNGTDNVDNGADTSNNGADNVDNGADTSNNGADTSNNGADTSDNDAGNVDNGADNGTNGADNVDNGAGNGNNEVGNGDTELDDAPKTGDNSVSPIFYMALALMSLMTIGFCLAGNKKKKHIQ
ncbi:SpaA isopeptide-forming pilin-related protein [Paenibacillus sp. M1]|uniref:SpaA isopeptide-forming pilin-related protein n=1 Tax=Paenibacillus haidiansis TaxID=1574488 RepID=A0ABU7VTJ5_9BACL